MPSFFPERIEDMVRMYAGKQEFVIVHEDVEYTVHASTADTVKDFKLKIIDAIPGLSSVEVGYDRIHFTRQEAVLWGDYGHVNAATVEASGIKPSEPWVMHIMPPYPPFPVFG